MNSAPVALFVYDRLDTTRQTVAHLQKNRGVSDTSLYIFSDGGKDDESWAKVNAVRAFCHSITGFKDITIIERPINYYLEQNIIDGISEVFQKYDRIIVLEDDICTSPYFLNFMNEALCFYQSEPRVMHISGFTNFDCPEKGEIYFSPHIAGWGWATWRDRWQFFRHYKNKEEAVYGLSDTLLQKIEYDGNFKCLHWLDKNPTPWDICWTISIMRQNGLSIYPSRTLVRNVGLQGGSHFNQFSFMGHYKYDRPYYTLPIHVGNIPINENVEIEQMYKKALKDYGMQWTIIGKVLRWIKRTIKR